LKIFQKHENATFSANSEQLLFTAAAAASAAAVNAHFALHFTAALHSSAMQCISPHDFGIGLV